MSAAVRGYLSWLAAGLACAACDGPAVSQGPSAPPGYAAPGQAPAGYAPPGYAAPGYAAPGYAAPGYAPPGYAPPGYAPPGASPASAPPAWSAPAPADRFAAARQQCVALTNGYRARLRLPPLAWRTDMSACADAEAAKDARSGQAHGGFGTACAGTGAQNECPAWDAASPERSVAGCLESMFQEGPGEPYADHGHYLNMTSTRYTGVACGFALDAKGALWVVQDYF